MREAKEKQLEYVAPPPRQKISDPEELAEYRMKKRKEFEDAIRKNRSKMVNWVKYAHWEESQQEIQREYVSMHSDIRQNFVLSQMSRSAKYLGTCVGRRLSKHCYLVEICRNGNA